MKKRYALWTAAGVGLVFVLACITVNIYFPEATVKQAAARDRRRDPQDGRGEERPGGRRAAAGPPRSLDVLARPGRLRPGGDDGLDAGHPRPQGRR